MVWHFKHTTRLELLVTNGCHRTAGSSSAETYSWLQADNCVSCKPLDYNGEIGAGVRAEREVCAQQVLESCERTVGTNVRSFHTSFKNKTEKA